VDEWLVAAPASRPCHLHSADDHADDGRPEGEDGQQAESDGIRIRVRPQAVARKHDEREQGTAAQDEDPAPDLEKAIGEESIHGGRYPI